MPATKKRKLPDALKLLMVSLDDQIQERMDETIESNLAELNEMVKQHRTLDVTFDGETHAVIGKQHGQLDELIRVAALRLNILLVGMAGTGKTHASEQVAEALGLPFYTMSVGAQTSKSDIIGYMSATGSYIKTHFRDAYEHGGVFLMDEIDAGNSNVLIQINAALSNGVSSFPDAMIRRHKDFVFIASANTYGTGANRAYVGRNQLDAATLDRFTVIDWNIDERLERSLSVGDKKDSWYETVVAVRDYIATHQIRALVTPRATQKGSILLHAGVAIKSTIDAVLLSSVPDDRREEIRDFALNRYNDFEQKEDKKQHQLQEIPF